MMEPPQTAAALRERPAAPAPGSARQDGPPRAEVVDIPLGMWASVREAWAARRLLPPLGARFLAKRIQGTKLDRAWLLIRPLMDAVGKTLLFGGVLEISTDADAPYFLFLMAGMLAWRLFERALLYGTRSFSIYSKLMKSFHFPLLLVPVAALAYPLLEIAVYWAVFVAALGLYLILDGTLYLDLSPHLVVLGIALVLVITMGALLWTSVLNAKARDTRFLLRYVLPVWLYLTPVVYPVTKLPDDFRWVAVVNPMTAPVELLKAGLLKGTPDPSTAMLLSSVGFAVVLFVSGLWYFCREATKSLETDAGFDDDEEDM